MWHIYRSPPPLLQICNESVFHVIFCRSAPSFPLTTAPSPLSLHLSNDGGIFFLPLIASLLPLSPSNDCSYLISSLAFPFSLSLTHIIPPTPRLPPSLSPSRSRLRLLSFFSPLVIRLPLPMSPCTCVSIQQTRVMLLYLPSLYPCCCTRIKGQLRWKS